MEWNELKEGQKYILHPLQMSSINLLKEYDGCTVQLIESPNIQPDTEDFAYRIRFCGEYPNDLSSEIWVPGNWLHPLIKINKKRKKCVCEYYVVINRGCMCGAGING